LRDTDIEPPKRAMARSDNAEPRLANSNDDISSPSRTLDRTLKEEPKLVKSTIDMLEPAPTKPRARPNIDKVDPSLAVDRIDMVDPAKDVATSDNETEARQAPCTEAAPPV
jgi:hypothetical protein